MLLLLPVLTMNLKNEYVSDIDNTYLPKFSFSLDFVKNIGNYITKRIGGREQAIWLYEKLNDQFFNILEHPNYMYGLEGHVFCRGDSYIRDFQHLNNVPEEAGYEKQFGRYIASLEKTAHEKNCYFLYVLCTDKKTIYPEFFPKGVHVMNRPSRTDLILAELDKRNINYLYAKQSLLDAKNKGVVVYNKKYDAGHWNDDGAFVFTTEIFRNLQEDYENLPDLKKEDYDIGEKEEKYLITSKFEINEKTPCYVSKTNNAIRTDQYMQDLPGEMVYYSHYENEKMDSAPSVLVFRDSYLNMASKFFIENFRESTFASYDNLTSLQDYEQYIDILRPDIVIFENVERTFPIAVLE